MTSDPQPAATSGAGDDPRRIVVVGPCASGKTTLVAALRARGYDARVSGQEHSVVSYLWRLSEPDVVVALAADLDAVRARRGEHWPAWLLELQLERLRDAVAAADVRIDTSRLDAEEVRGEVLAFLKGEREQREEA